MKKVTTQYYCDKCNEETALKDSVAVKIDYQFGATWVHPTKHEQITKHICKDCAKKLGIIREIVENDEIVPEVKTTSEQLYDILAQIVWENSPISN